MDVVVGYIVDSRPGPGQAREPEQRRPLKRRRAASKAIAAIPTKYQGVQYRSRLEARWAAFLVQLRWRFEYEPDLQAGYVIPDFMLLGTERQSTPRAVLLECKPATTVLELAMARSDLIARLHRWLRGDVEREIRELDESDASLTETDRALDDLVRVDCGDNPRGSTRRIIVAGPALHPHRGGESLSIDGIHGFCLCTFAETPENNHVGLATEDGERCILCHRVATAWMPPNLVMDAWKVAGNETQWCPPADPQFVATMQRAASRGRKPGQ